MNKVTGFISLFLVLLAGPATARADCVVLLHGLARTSSAMETLQTALEDHGYIVANIDYPSRDKPIEELSDIAVESGSQTCRQQTDGQVHFVTHSLGGILVRYYLEHKPINNLGHVVMIAPPNHGSEIVDNLATVPGFNLIMGPAGSQLGTGENSIPLQLGPVDYSVGVLAGTRSINPFLSSYLAKPDDGKVSVASTRVEGMTDFRTVDATHTFIMRDDNVIRHTIAFLESGKFLATNP